MLRKLLELFGFKDTNDVLIVEEKAAAEGPPVVVHVQSHKVRVYKDSKKEWRWKITAANGKQIAASSESYKNRKDAVANVNSITSLNVTIS